MEPTRRQLVQMLGAIGLSRAALGELRAQTRGSLSTADLRGALAIQGRDLDEQHIAGVRRALQRNLEQFQAVRDLEIDDGVVPALFFDPLKR